MSNCSQDPAIRTRGILGADMSINIRRETTADQDAIRHVNRLAFGQDDEART